MGLDIDTRREQDGALSVLPGTTSSHGHGNLQQGGTQLRHRAWRLFAADRPVDQPLPLFLTIMSKVVWSQCLQYHFWRHSWPPPALRMQSKTNSTFQARLLFARAES